MRLSGCQEEVDKDLIAQGYSEIVNNTAYHPANEKDDISELW